MNRIIEGLKPYLPSLGMALAAVVGVFVTAATDNVLTGDEIGNLLLAGLGAFLTYVVPRLRSARWLKPATAALIAGLQFAVSVWADGVSMSEWGMIVLTILGALGVAATNKYVPVTEPRSIRTA